MPVVRTPIYPRGKNHMYAVPDACLECGLYEYAQTHCIYPEGDVRPHTQGKPTILVLGGFPSQECDRTGVPFSGRRSGGAFLRTFLQELEVKWVLSHAVRCFPGHKPDGSKLKPNVKHQRSCVSSQLPELIRFTKPALIVLLGEPAMRAVLGKNAPKNLTKALNNVLEIQVDGVSYPVMVQKDPANDNIPDAPDMTEDYIAFFEKAQRIAQEGFAEKTYEYELVATAERFAQLGEKLKKKISHDWEYAANDKLEKARTYWHPETEPLCAQISEFEDDGETKAKNYVILPHLVRRGDIWQRVLSNRFLVGHNLKVENQCLFSFAKVCVYDYIPEDLKLDGEYVMRDTFLRANADDSGKMGNSLKGCAVRERGVDDWSLPVDADIAAANARIALEHSELKKQITSAKRMLLKAPTPEEKDAWRDTLKQLENLQSRLRPPGSAHFGDVSKPNLYCYGSGDVEENLFLDKIQLERGMDIPQPLAELHQRMLFITTMVERQGLPVDLKRFGIIKKAWTRKYLHFTRELLKFPQVRKVLRNDKELAKHKAKGELTRALLYKRMSPKRTFFLRDLAIECGMLHKIPLAPAALKEYNKGIGSPEEYRAKGKISVNEDTLIDLSGGEEDTKPQHRKPSWTRWENKTEEQRIWTYIYTIRQLFDVYSKFIKPLQAYAPDGHLRTDFRLGAVDTDEKSNSAAKSGTTTGRLACIAKGTLITVRNKSGIIIETPIEMIREGDTLYGFDFTGKPILQTVKWAGKTDSKRQTLKIEWESKWFSRRDSLCLTHEHRVRLADGNWIRADELQLGFRLMGPLRDQDVISVGVGPVVDVYDITMEGEPCFVAGGICAHNSAEPNLQNLKKDAFLRWVFAASVYGSEWILAESDYDRIEPVCLTAVAGIQAWRTVFLNGWDLYQVIANEVYHLGISLEGPVDEVRKRLEDGVPKELRENAKTRTLAIMYDESPRAFAYRANITIEDAEEFYAAFAKRYPEINRYKEDIRWKVRKSEIIYTSFGRRRFFGPLPQKWHRHYKRDLASLQRQAINMPIQAMASDITLWKAYEVYRWLQKNNLLDRVKVTNLVHDAIWFAVHKSVAVFVMQNIKRIMEDTSTFPGGILGDIPMRMGWKIGFDLGNMYEVKGSPNQYKDKVVELFKYKKLLKDEEREALAA